MGTNQEAISDKASRLMSDFNIALKLSRRTEDGWESWGDIVDRTRRHYLVKAFEAGAKWHDRINKAFELTQEKVVLPSQRALQFSGAPLFRNEMRVYNCAGSYCDRPRFFAECFWLLLSGCGTGFSVQDRYINKLPSLNKPKGIKRLTIEDSIEGWADALDALMNSYFEVKSKVVDFDYSQIREEGAPIATGATHAGPQPLKDSLEKIRGVLDSALQGSGRLTSVDCSDIYCHFSNAVLAGGSRRSAGIVCFSPDDKAMVEYKVGNWFTDNPQRARVNISAVCDNAKREDFDKIFDACKQWGDPAYLFLDSDAFLVNPCGEITFCPLLIQDPEGNVLEHYPSEMLSEEGQQEARSKGYKVQSGWQLCNLTEMNATKITSMEMAKRMAEASAIFGTIQAGMIDTGYLGDVSHQILKREMNLGCSITGIQQNRSMVMNHEVLSLMLSTIKEVNWELSRALGWRPASRLTSIKPSGNSSVNLGCSAGISPVHAERYIRRVQVNPNSSAYIAYKSSNPEACEDSVWSATGDKVVSFPVKSTSKALMKGNCSALSLLRDIKLLQREWARAGTVINRCDGLNHGVSNTVTVKESEWEDVREWIWENREHLSGITMLSSYGDLSFQQAPYERVYTEEEQLKELPQDLHAKAEEGRLKWESLRASLKAVDFTVAGGSISGATFEGCDSEGCLLPNPSQLNS